jgi:hypothetical protein
MYPFNPCLSKISINQAASCKEKVSASEKQEVIVIGVVKAS